MSRLLAFGCSYTYGASLEDCYHPKYGYGPKPSQYAWPKIVAKKLRRECVNLGEPGASNKFIWYSITNTEYKKDDMVVILWSHLDRHSVFHSVFPQANDPKWKRHKFGLDVDVIGPWTNCIQQVHFYNHLHSDIDAKIVNNLYVDHAARYLDNLGITNYHFSIRKEYWADKCSFNHTIMNEPSMATLVEQGGDKGLDNAHPGPQSHAMFANEVTRTIKKGRKNETTL